MPSGSSAQMSSWKEISRLRQDRGQVLQILKVLFVLEARCPFTLDEQEIQFLHDTLRLVHLATPEGWERSFNTRWAAKLVEVRDGVVMRRGHIYGAALSD